MKILADTNVILDVALKRPVFVYDSFAVYKIVEEGKVSGYVSSSAVTDIFYLLHKALKDTSAVYHAIENVCKVFIVAPVTEITIKTALALRWKDFEDAVQYAAAQEQGADYIITRNSAGFENPLVQCVSPAEFNAVFGGDTLNDVT